MFSGSQADNHASEGWFAVYTLACREKQVARHLAAREVEHFLPLTKRRARWKNGCNVVVEEPLFPGYLFVHISRGERVRVVSVPGVHSIVGHGKDPSALPSAEIESLRRGIDFLNIERYPYIEIQDKVTILRGPLEGLTGTVIRRKNGLRFILSLDLIMKSVSVEIAAADLAPADSEFVARNSGLSLAGGTSSTLS